MVQCVHTSVHVLHHQVRAAPHRGKLAHHGTHTIASPSALFRRPEKMSNTSETTTRPLPPGVTEADLDNALAAFAAAIGEEKVATEAESLEDFQDPFQVP